MLIDNFQVFVAAMLHIEHCKSVVKERNIT